MVYRYGVIPYLIQKVDVRGAQRLENAKNDDEHSIWVVAGGCAVCTLLERRLELCAGNVFVLREAGMDIAVHGGPAVLYRVVYKNNELAKMAGSFRSLVGFQQLFVVEPFFNVIGYRQRPMLLNAPDLARVVDTVQDMLAEQQRAETGFEQMINSYFLILVTLLSRKYTLEAESTDRRISRLAGTAAYMQAHYLDNPTVESLAKLSRFSLRHFIKIFSDTFGQTPKQYLLNLKLERARMVLATTDVPITQVAFSCGFNDSNYFSRMFKAAYLVTPQAYRKVQRSH